MVVGNKALLLFIGATNLGAISIFISNTSTASDQDDEDSGNQFGINEYPHRHRLTMKWQCTLCAVQVNLPSPTFCREGATGILRCAWLDPWQWWCPPPATTLYNLGAFLPPIYLYKRSMSPILCRKLVPSTILGLLKMWRALHGVTSSFYLCAVFWNNRRILCSCLYSLGSFFRAGFYH